MKGYQDKRNGWTICEQAAPPQVTFWRRDWSTLLLVILVVSSYVIVDMIWAMLSSFSRMFAPATLLILGGLVAGSLVLVYGCAVKLVVTPAGIAVAWTWYGLPYRIRRYPLDCRIESDYGNWDIEEYSGIRLGYRDQRDIHDEVFISDSGEGVLAQELEQARQAMRALSK